MSDKPQRTINWLKRDGAGNGVFTRTTIPQTIDKPRDQAYHISDPVSNRSLFAIAMILLGVMLIAIVLALILTSI